MRVALSSALVALALCAGALFDGGSHAAGATPLMIVVTASTPVAGQPVTMTWKLTNSSGKVMLGTVLFKLNGASLNPTGTINIDSVQPGKSLSGTYAIMPSPGWNSFSVALINTSQVAVAGSGKTTIPSQLPQDAPASPAPAGGGATHNVPVQTVVASGSVDFNASPLNATVSKALTAQQRVQLMKDYAPLLLYSFDHGSDEKYRPIDVIPFVKGSTLAGAASNADLSANQIQILNPTGTSATGTISAGQLVLPVPLYLQPSPAARTGTDWGTIMAGVKTGPDVGLYGRAFLVDVAQLQDDADPSLKARLAARYRCTVTACAAQVVKLEYWQFFGFSHDYDGSWLDKYGLRKAGNLVESYTDHDGDWCTVQLYVDVGWWLSGRPDRAILAVYHYLHGKQAGFDMSLAIGAPGRITVPARSHADKGPTFPALEYGGPNVKQTPYFSIKVKGEWLPPGGPDEKVQESHAQNNVVQLAADTSSDPGGSMPSAAEFRHPVVYVEWGGHEFWPTPKWSIFGASKHNGTGQYAYFGNTPVDLGADAVSPDPAAGDDINLVRFYAGYWGANGGSGPPQGPSLHTQWYWNLGSDCTRFKPVFTPPSAACIAERLLLKEIETVSARTF